ncbi:MAG TPA: M48 family metallopeptidase [Opitutaceae bacterium]|nr:M48 family metallopeptidase [Opitutaceae bacterium]
MLEPVEIVAAALLVAKCAGDLVLGALNRREIQRHSGAVPPAYAGVMDAATYARAVEYSLVKNRFSQFEELFGAAVLAVVVFSGVLPWSRAAWTGWLGAATWSQALWLVAVGVALAVPALPFDWWGTFRLEARFGFNKSTLGLWLGDKVKGSLVALALGVPLLWLLLALVGWMGRWWWVWGLGVVVVFQLLMLVLYPLLILPLFNKLTPLPEGELRSDLLALADRTGFAARTIEVMDGSKRSGHSNAFFTGFGRFRRIVLFDTLINQLGRDELAAVLAHEIGHYKRGHIPKMLALSASFMAGGFFAIDWLMRSPWFLGGFGFPADAGAAPALLLVTLLGGLATYWLSPLLNGLSRRHEYEADAFARAAMGGPAPLVGALHKLAEKNLTNLTPHPWFSTFHYSHPTLLERERALLAEAR